MGFNDFSLLYFTNNQNILRNILRNEKKSSIFVLKIMKKWINNRFQPTYLKME